MSIPAIYDPFNSISNHVYGMKEKKKKVYFLHSAPKKCLTSAYYMSGKKMTFQLFRMQRKFIIF